MRLAELTDYAAEKYQIREEHKWTDFPGFSVLSHPKTGKWIALLMRGWDSDTGTEIERCDLKCGNEVLFRSPRPYLAAPIRMHGSRWIDITFDSQTETDVVFALFDKAVSSGDPNGYTIVLASRLPAGENSYKETALPFANSSYRPRQEKIPERLREMKRLYEYGRESLEARAENFYRQAVYMADFEDDAPWSGDFICYFPTYRDLTTQQLRGYFSWRTQVRKGNFQPIATSAAYIYLYELLNGVGADSPEDCLMKLREFEAGYLDSGIGDKRMRQNLHRWMLEFAVLNDISPERTADFADPDLMARDRALAVLRSAADRDDEEVFPALCVFDRKKIKESPVLTQAPERGKRLFCDVWRKALRYQYRDRDTFTLCFGVRKTRRWVPLSNAVYYERTKPADRKYVLNEVRSFQCRSGDWKVSAYEKLSFDNARFQGILHETDARLRRYLKTGRYLKENPADEWIAPIIETVIEADRRAVIEASRPKITIDLSGLEQIRRDAAGTRDSLLSEEEREEMEAPAEAAASLPAPDLSPDTDLPLDVVQVQILRELLRGGDGKELLKANHLMPSIAADFINEALFDEFGDTVLICEDDRLILVEDYMEDLEQLLGGNSYG